MQQLHFPFDDPRIAKRQKRNCTPPRHYHEQTYKLLGLSLPNLQKLTDRFPCAISEWFAAPNAIQVLRNYSNDDFPVTPDEFKTRKIDDKQIVLFLYENQSVCWWGFVDGDDEDPPVYVIVDPHEKCEVIQCTDHFSTFVYTRIFDFKHWSDRVLSIWGETEPINEEMLSSLRGNFDVEPVTHGWPGDTQYRFSRGDQRILIWNSKIQAGWRFSADSSESVVSLFEGFAHLMAWHSDIPQI